MLVVVPVVWGLIRRTEGLPMFGSPTVQELEDAGRPDGRAAPIALTDA
jgi:hypothetical protein